MTIRTREGQQGTGEENQDGADNHTSRKTKTGSEVYQKRFLRCSSTDEGCSSVDRVCILEPWNFLPNSASTFISIFQLPSITSPIMLVSFTGSTVDCSRESWHSCCWRTSVSCSLWHCVLHIKVYIHCQLSAAEWESNLFDFHAGDCSLHLITDIQLTLVLIKCNYDLSLSLPKCLGA